MGGIPRPSRPSVESADPARRALWLQEALGDEQDGPRPALHGAVTADVCIVGGGYCGLWTALELKERAPELRVAILEAEICGAGASGRNGGFAMSWWQKYGSLEKLCGPDDARWLCHESERAITTLGEFCDRHGVEGDFRQAGWLWVGTSSAQANSWRATVDEVRAAGGDDVFRDLTPEEARARSGSPVVVGGVLDRTTATVHPGRLVRGLRRVALELGVEIYEHSRVTEVGQRPGAGVQTAHGRVHADVVVVAANAWTLTIPGFGRLRRAVVPVVSDMIATAPVPDRLDALGFSGGEAITDSRMLVHYYHRRADGRVILGRGGGALGFGGGFGEDFHYDRRRSDWVTRSLHELYPSLRDVGVTHAWAGPIDRSTTGVPFFGQLGSSPRVLYGIGFSGNGVAPSVLGGRILAGMALGEDSRWTRNGLTSGRPAGGLFPPEPVRYVGGNLVRVAVARKEALDDRGRRADPATRWLAGLAPSGLFRPREDKGAESPEMQGSASLGSTVDPGSSTNQERQLK